MEITLLRCVTRLDLAKVRVERSNTQKLSASSTLHTCWGIWTPPPSHAHTHTHAHMHARRPQCTDINKYKSGSPTIKVGKSSSKKQLSATLPCGGLNEKCPPQALISESQLVMLFVEMMQSHWRKHVTEGRM